MNPLAAIGEIAGLASPLVEDAVKHKYSAAHKYRMERFEKITQDILAGDSDADDRMDAFISDLLRDASKPRGDVSTKQISVPLSDFGRIIEGFSEGIKEKEEKQ